MTFRKITLWLVLIAVALTGCVHRPRQYSVTYLTVFDTVTTVTAMARSQEEFDAAAAAIHDELLRLHRLFDIYNSYEGINNLKTVNERAGQEPVSVDPDIIALLKDCKRYHDLTGGKVNAAMGSVLRLWHEARTASLEDPESARLPEQAALEAAALHTDFDAVVIDEEASTVFITDPLVQLDVGAIAKGWAVQQVAGKAPAGYLLSVGGNVCATGPKDAEGTPWVVAVQNPEGGDSYLHTLSITGGSVVTSGDYQRTYQVEGRSFHHIIDPGTLYPSEYWRSVTVCCADSGLADALSTALFVLPLEQGQQLLDTCGAEAMWVDADGEMHRSPGF